MGKAVGIEVEFLFADLTATPHNGKEEDFQLFMALLGALHEHPESFCRLPRASSPAKPSLPLLFSLCSLV